MIHLSKIAMILATLMALAFPPSASARDSAGCVVEHDGVELTLSLTPAGAIDRFSVAFQSADLTASDGSPFRFDLSGFAMGNPDDRVIAETLDNLLLTMNFTADTRATKPAFLYLVREQYIPLDLAPGKLWYPDFYDEDGALEMAITLGDLERFAEMGPADPPVEKLGWILKAVTDQPFVNEIVASGTIEMQAILAAKDRIRSVLNGLVTPQGIRTACKGAID